MALPPGTLNELALFAGAGGGILGGILSGFRTICAVEIEPYCREVLLRRQRDGVLPLFAIWDDAETFDGRPWRGLVDVITAGFPCQPFSSVGKRRGKDDERNMWPHTYRTICEVQPHFVLLENVPGLLSCGYLGRVVGDLASSGYDARWDCISAFSVGAPHRRDRLWIVAYSCISRLVGFGYWAVSPKATLANSSSSCKVSGVADADCSRPQPRARGRKETLGDGQGVRRAFYSSEALADSTRIPDGKQTHEALAKPRGGQARTESGRRGWWATEPDVGRVAAGVAFRMDRLKALGNGQVARVAHEAWEKLKPR